ncbi:unknown [Ruminococcus sp. CAG:563]|nr:unknown [Ruminococcus sp. CAG:563]
MEQEIKNQIIYLVTLGLIRQFFREGKIDITLAEKLNRKMPKNCRAIVSR